MFPLVLPVFKIIPLSRSTVSNISSVLVTGFKTLPKGKIKFYAVFYVINQLFDEIHIQPSKSSSNFSRIHLVKFTYEIIFSSLFGTHTVNT